MPAKFTRRDFAAKASALIGSTALPSFEGYKCANAATSNPLGSEVRALFGTWFTESSSVPMGVTYILPLGLDNNYSFLSSQAIALNYSWQDDADKVYENFLSRFSSIKSSIDSTGFARGKSTNPNEFSGQMKTQIERREWGATLVGFKNIQNTAGTLPALFAPYRINKPSGYEGYYSIVNWSKVPYINTGFKLDTAGIGGYLVAAFKTVTFGDAIDIISVGRSSNLSRSGSDYGGDEVKVWDSNVLGNTRVHNSVKNLYFAGDSFSHYGGWVEGAFQSALNTASGILYSALKANEMVVSSYQSDLSIALLDDQRYALDYGVTPVMNPGCSKGTRRVEANRNQSQLYIFKTNVNNKECIDISFTSANASGTVYRCDNVARVRVFCKSNSLNGNKVGYISTIEIINSNDSTLSVGQSMDSGQLEPDHEFGMVRQHKFCQGLIKYYNSDGTLKSFQLVFRNS